MINILIVSQHHSFLYSVISCPWDFAQMYSSYFGGNLNVLCSQMLRTVLAIRYPAKTILFLQAQKVMSEYYGSMMFVQNIFGYVVFLDSQRDYWAQTNGSSSVANSSTLCPYYLIQSNATFVMAVWFDRSSGLTKYQLSF